MIRRPSSRGNEEISIRKGHTYRNVVGGLLHHRPVRFGGRYHSEARTDGYPFIWEKKAKKIRLVVMICGR